MGEQYANLIMIALILIISLLAIYFFLKTQLGMSLRATGDNEDMVRASSINSDAMKIMGLAIANAFVALAGAILAQYQSFSDVSGGIGMMVKMCIRDRRRYWSIIFAGSSARSSSALILADIMSANL